MLLAGHVNGQQQGNGALFQLSQITAHAQVRSSNARGLTSTWQVISVREVNKSALPQDIFTASGPRRLVIVTCGSALLRIAAGHGSYYTYEDNVIVTALPT